MTNDYLTRFEGQTLVLCFEIQREHRVYIPQDSGPMGLANAIEDAVRGAALTQTPGVIPDSIHFRIEK